MLRGLLRFLGRRVLNADNDRNKHDSSRISPLNFTKKLLVLLKFLTLFLPDVPPEVDRK